ncbi:MAG TPA: EamA family transporter [Alphaproteobacteria bacterium]|nr:EamA family transporter [Alphaproteobacteria bacterium]
MRPALRPMTLGDWLLLGLLGVLWSGSYIFVAIAVREVPPFTLVFVRVSLAALLLWLMAVASGAAFPQQAKTWAALALGGVLNCALPFVLLFWGQQHLPASLAAILISTGPLLTIVCAHFLTPDERMTAQKLIGVSLGLVGAAVLVGVDALSDFGVQSLAELGVLGAALCYALAAVVSRQFAGQPPIVTAVGQLATSGLAILPAALIVDRPWQMPWPGAAGFGATVGLTLFSTALAYIVFFRLLRNVGAGNAMLVSFLTPVGASILGTALLGEHLAPHNLAGMVLIFAGFAVIDGRLLSAARRIAA